MRIEAVESWRQSVALKRPYTIATRTVDSVELVFLRLVGSRGVAAYGSASPAQQVTGESPEDCAAALAQDQLAWLVGQDARHLGTLARRASARMAATPAARAAVDMALCDLFARAVGVPLADLLGRVHTSLPTSVTIGIKDTGAALAEADEYLARGFRCLKVKIGLDLDADIDRVRTLRQHVGAAVAIRVDANQGYTREETLRFARATQGAGVELLEQPLPASAVAEMRALPQWLRARVAADESLHSDRDALLLLRPPAACGIFNIKLMKCGGITPALAIAQIAAAADCHLMWGCMDESAVSIAAALHAAFAAPATRYLDLDGSFDLAADIAEGGFVLEDGCLRLGDRPGLGVEVCR